MDKKNYGFVTFADPKIAMKFLEVCCQGTATAAAAVAAATAAAAARELRSSHWQRIMHSWLACCYTLLYRSAAIAAAALQEAAAALQGAAAAQEWGTWP
jgi:hypothetical protein